MKTEMRKHIRVSHLKAEGARRLGIDAGGYFDDVRCVDYVDLLCVVY